MKKVIIATAVIAVGLVSGLAPNKAQGLQYGVNAGYSSVGFTLHGGSVEFLLGVGGKDRHRPQGSVLHFGFAGASGQGTSDLTQATWSGFSFGQFVAGLGTNSNTFFGLLNSGYGITDTNNARGEGTAYLISASYEWVFSKRVPGLGIIGGGELYLSEGGFESKTPSNLLTPSVKTEGGIGGGVVVGVSYYLRNGLNASFKTGLGALDPGEVSLGGVKVEPETVFYASPTFSLGYIY